MTIGGHKDKDRRNSTVEKYEILCYLKSKQEQMKPHWIEMIGSDLYFYKSATDRT